MEVRELRSLVESAQRPTIRHTEWTHSIDTFPLDVYPSFPADEE